MAPVSEGPEGSPQVPPTCSLFLSGDMVKNTRFFKSKVYFCSSVSAPPSHVTLASKCPIIHQHLLFCHLKL